MIALDPVVHLDRFTQLTTGRESSATSTREWAGSSPSSQAKIAHESKADVQCGSRARSSSSLAAMPLSLNLPPRDSVYRRSDDDAIVAQADLNLIAVMQLGLLADRLRATCGGQLITSAHDWFGDASRFRFWWSATDSLGRVQ
ncbi:MAG: hypothetical protein ACYC91_10585 [Solirubrobacteraceae bacterium]